MSISPEQPTPQDSPNTAQGKVWGEVTISRRQFFAYSILGGSAAGMATLSHPKVAKAVADKLDHKSILDRLSDELVSNRRSALATTVETVVMWAGTMALGNLLDRVEIPHGGHAGDGPLYDEQIAKRPLRTYIRDNLAIPVVEEALFRMIPSAFFAEDLVPKVNLRWDVGLTSAVIFGLVHNLSKPEPEKITIHLNSLPLEQLIIGTYCWYAQRKGGFIHAAGAHVLYNNLCGIYPNLFGSRRGESKER